MVAAEDGRVLRRLRINDSNNTGMETVYGRGAGADALLYNGGILVVSSMRMASSGVHSTSMRT